MIWTTKKPTQPGWYWVRIPGDIGTAPWIVEILSGELVADSREWSSEPIPEPQERR